MRTLIYPPRSLIPPHSMERLVFFWAGWLPPAACGLCCRRRQKTDHPAQYTQVWELSKCKLRTNHFGHTGYISTVTVSPDGSLCASGGKDGITMLWDLNEGKHLYSLEAGDEIKALVFSPNRYWLCAATGSGCKVFDLETKSVPHPHSISTVHLRTDIGSDRVRAPARSLAGPLSTRSARNSRRPRTATSRRRLRLRGRRPATFCTSATPTTLSVFTPSSKRCKNCQF